MHVELTCIWLGEKGADSLFHVELVAGDCRISQKLYQQRNYQFQRRKYAEGLAIQEAELTAAHYKLPIKRVEHGDAGTPETE